MEMVDGMVRMQNRAERAIRRRTSRRLSGRRAEAAPPSSSPFYHFQSKHQTLFAMAAPGPSTYMQGAPLPPGWSQYFTHDGQPYYYNAATGQSTHEPPALVPSSSSPAAAAKPKKEKPKAKDPIPGAEGWLRVTTNMGNVFYTHTATKRSEWTVPEEICEAVEAMEVAERGASGADGRAASVESKRKREDEEAQHAQAIAQTSRTSEGIDAAELIAQPPQRDAPPSKRPRGSASGSAEPTQPPEDDDDDDDDAQWQRQLAAEMAAEAEESEQGEASESAHAVHQPAQPSIPAFSPPPPPPGGYTGPPPGFSPAPPPSAPQAPAAAKSKSPSAPAASPTPTIPQLSLEEGRALFMRMLTSLNGTREEVNPMAPWDRELPKFVHRSEYAALRQLKDRQDAFNDWCKERLRQKREEKKRGASGAQATAPGGDKPAASSSSSQSPAPEASSSSSSSSARATYDALLRSSVTSTRTRFDDFRRDFKKDRRFYSFGRDDREREKVFKAWLVQLGEEKRKAAQKAEETFLALLGEVVGSEMTGRWKEKDDRELKDAVWREVKKVGGMEKRKEYDEVGSSSRRAELFVQWVKEGSASGSSSNGGKATTSGTSAPAAAISSSSSSSQPLSKEQRQQQALLARQAAVQQQSSALSRQNARALQAAQRQDAELAFGQLLIDYVRDPLAAWEDVAADERLKDNALPWGAKRELFEKHRERLVEKKRGQLEGIFERFARQTTGAQADDDSDDDDDENGADKARRNGAQGVARLDVDGDVLLPLVEVDDDYERLGMRAFLQRGLQRSLREEWDRWQRMREEKAKVEFFEMLKGECATQPGRGRSASS